MRKYYQGIYIPKNPEKYIGNINNITFRSGLEKTFMIFLDTNINIVSWNSEGIAIPYFNTFDHKTHKYYPDFLVTLKNKENIIKTILIEIKPERQTKMPTGKNKTKRLTEELIVYTKNLEKWDAAKLWCTQNNIEFQIITEKEINAL